MKTLLQRLGLRSRVHGSAVFATASLSLYPEAQLAGCVPSPADLRARGAPANAAPAESADRDALVARFYCC